MKTLVLLLSLFVSYSSFAADGVQAPGVPGTAAAVNPTEMNHSGDAVADKTLLSKPAGDACKADREKFCSSVKTGGGAMMKCMKSHEADLSVDCKAKGEWMKKEFIEKRKEVKAACEKELNQFCSDVKGPKKKMDCLQTHSADLSQSCKDSLPASPAKK